MRFYLTSRVLIASLGVASTELARECAAFLVPSALVFPPRGVEGTAAWRGASLSEKPRGWPLGPYQTPFFSATWRLTVSLKLSFVAQDFQRKHVTSSKRRQDLVHTTKQNEQYSGTSTDAALGECGHGRLCL